MDSPEQVRRQAVPLGSGAKRTLVVLAVMILLLATGLIPAPVAGLLAALAVIATRVLSVQQAYDGIGWTTVILVGGLMSLSTAMVSSGAAQQLADALVALVGDAGPYALLAGLFVVTTTLGQLISNMATAFIVVPVGLAAAIQMDVSPAPILMAIAVFAAAALLTPVATPQTWWSWRWCRLPLRRRPEAGAAAAGLVRAGRHRVGAALHAVLSPPVPPSRQGVVFGRPHPAPSRTVRSRTRLRFAITPC